MPRPSQQSETHGLTNPIIHHALAAARLLLNVSDDGTSSNPYVKGIAGLSILIIESVQSVKSNKAQCLALLERIYAIITAIINICGEDELLPSNILRNLSHFFDTLQKVYSYVRAQADLGLIRRVWKSAETASLLGDCNAGLQHAIDVFGIQTGLAVSSAITKMKDHSELRHEEILQLLEQANNSRSTFSLQSSTSSLLLLPARPQIFYGRNREVDDLLKGFLGTETYRTVILGPGGIGKSSLALTVLHHPDMIARFGSCRYFISLESSTSAGDMLNAIAAFFDLEPGGKVDRTIVKYVTGLSSPCVIVLDNLEDCWESPGSRSDVEDFLSLLSGIPDVHLMVTMRGAERPGKVKWTRPFISALDPLDDAAARQTFLDIVDAPENNDFTALLALTDNLPLAITLMANLASFEGGKEVLARWKHETTSVLSEGFDKRANLDKSIMLSLSSPRMLSDAHANELLSLMSLLPDGISEHALMQMRLPFSAHISRSKSTLLRCSLIYCSANGRLRTLVPIREFVRERLPPSSASLAALCADLYGLASLFRDYMKLPSRVLVQRLSAEFANVRAVAAHTLARGLHLSDTVRCTIDLMHFNVTAYTAPFEYARAEMENAVEQLGDLVLEGDYLLAQARGKLQQPEARDLADNALNCYERGGDRLGQVRAHHTLANWYALVGQFQKAIETARRGALIAEQSGDLPMRAFCMTVSSKVHRNTGDLRTAILHGREARRLAQASGNLTAEAAVTQQYASCCAMVGDYSRALTLCAAVTSLLSGLGLATMEVHAYRNVLNTSAEVHHHRSEYDATKALRIRLLKARRAFDEMPRAWDLIGIAHADVELGDLASARRGLEAVSAVVSPVVRKAAGIDIQELVLEGDIDFHAGEHAKAERGLIKALKSSGWVDLQIMAVERLSNIMLETKRISDALRYSVLLLAYSRKAADNATTHQAFRRLGDIFLVQDDMDTARTLFLVALDGFRLMSIHRGTADCLLRLADLRNSRGENSAARKMWSEARSLFEKSSQKAEIARCDERLTSMDHPAPKLQNYLSMLPSW